MTLKRGTINAHHFAHRPQANCDSWYFDNAGKSPWHKKMQEQFHESFREVKVCDDNDVNTWHIADIFLSRKDKGNVVVEFQHSPISRETFWERTRFYQNNGCNTIDGKRTPNVVVWVFDYYQKEIFIQDIEGFPNWIHGEWPGRDKIRFLNDFFPDYNNIFVVFYSFINNYEKDDQRYIRLHDPITRVIFSNIFHQEDEFRSFDAERIEIRDFVNYIMEI